MKGVGVLIIIGLVAWLFIRRQKQAQATQTYSSLSEYEALHATVPITKYATKEIPVFGSLSEYNAAMGVI